MKLINCSHYSIINSISMNFINFIFTCYPIKCDSIERPVIITIAPDTNTPTFMNAIKDCYKNWEYYHNEKKKFYIYIFGTPTISKIPTKLSEKYSYFKSNDDSCITFVPFAPNCMVIRDFNVKRKKEDEKN